MNKDNIEEFEEIL